MLKVNEYFNGKVKSIALQTATLPATVGVMVAGEYEFGTDCKEIMTVISGTLEIQQPGEAAWQTYLDGQTFEVEANIRFKVKALSDTAYLCKYWR
jgi:purine/pyrimidine-nucleoside phosphorylase